MSNAIDPQEIARADTIAFHFYTKLFYVINQARATEGPNPNAKSDKWFNLESPDSELLPKEARDAFKSISSLIPSPGIEPFEVQVLLSVPVSNMVLVHTPPDSSRVTIEPKPRFVLLESWTLDFDPSDVYNSGIPAATTYKHGIVLFRSLFSLLRLLPTWKLYQRLRRKMGGINRNANFGIQLRVRSYSGKDDILSFGECNE
ncbi:hypothetical protein CVT24_011270 [Panaeolus cyanescens]|uniref:Autophagy-related protein 13 n=1 Tax=Panaeolus cyanescens TaxID=181874 RepID=A0A409VLQ3_9AGAR|nr:hypothetical protein CVT24_011270 [Panaeolus cyanescens]